MEILAWNVNQFNGPDEYYNEGLITVNSYPKEIADLVMAFLQKDPNNVAILQEVPAYYKGHKRPVFALFCNVFDMAGYKVGFVAKAIKKTEQDEKEKKTTPRFFTLAIFREDHWKQLGKDKDDKRFIDMRGDSKVQEEYKCNRSVELLHNETKLRLLGTHAQAEDFTFLDKLADYAVGKKVNRF